LYIKTISGLGMILQFVTATTVLIELFLWFRRCSDYV